MQITGAEDYMQRTGAEDNMQRKGAEDNMQVIDVYLVTILLLLIGQVAGLSFH